MSALILCLAQGLGMGLSPVAPGTLGSLAGVFLTAILLATGNPLIYLAGMLAGLALSVWVCGEAEHILGQKDPGSIVFDEIAALPVCFLGWVGWHWWGNHELLPPDHLFRGGGWLVTLAVFAAFRFFDILKPWPVRQSQALPGGWGITTDDFLAAVYVNLILGPVWWFLAPG